MKKITILTSVLALAACAGGSGGGSGVAITNTQDTASIDIIRAGSVTGGISEDVAESNQKVTGMVSQILETENGNQINVGRSAATNITHNGKTYTKAYDLSDVDFVFVDEGSGRFRFKVDNETKKITHFDLFDDEDVKLIRDGDKEYVVYNKEFDNNELYVEDGELKSRNPLKNISFDEKNGMYLYKNGEDTEAKIVKIDGKFYEMYDEGYPFQIDERDEIVKRFERKDDSFTFQGVIAAEDHQQVDADLTYVSVGKDLGLKYSDFGYFKIEVDDALNRPVNLIGGYEIKNIDPSDLPENTTIFTGKAVAGVISILGGEGSGIVLTDEKGSDVIKGNATLTFNRGNEELAVTFPKNWYDVTYKNGKIEFSDTGKNIDEKFQLLTGNDVENETNADIRYYGDNNNVKEAVGLIQHRNCQGTNGCTEDYDEHNEIRMNLSFGVH